MMEPYTQLFVRSKDPNAVVKRLQEQFAMKGCGAPEYFLGMKISSTSDDGTWHQAGVHTQLSAKTYIHNSLQKLSQLAEADEFRKQSTPMSEMLHPELDMTDLLRPKEHHLYQAIIGSLNWMVILGRIDIALLVQC